LAESLRRAQHYKSAIWPTYFSPKSKLWTKARNKLKKKKEWSDIVLPFPEEQEDQATKYAGEVGHALKRLILVCLFVIF
jgi:hypothetical protein